MKIDPCNPRKALVYCDSLMTARYEQKVCDECDNWPVWCSYCAFFACISRPRNDKRR